MTPSEIMELRLALGLSQAEMAARIGVDRSAVWRYEAGERTPMRSVLLHLQAMRAELDAAAA